MRNPQLHFQEFKLLKESLIGDLAELSPRKLVDKKVDQFRGLAFVAVRPLLEQHLVEAGGGETRLEGIEDGLCLLRVLEGLVPGLLH
jgi:hypothetical protein